MNNEINYTEQIQEMKANRRRIVKQGKFLNVVSTLIAIPIILAMINTLNLTVEQLFNTLVLVIGSIALVKAIKYVLIVLAHLISKEE